MGYTHKAYGSQSLWNLRSWVETNPISPNEIMISNHGPSIIDASLNWSGINIRALITGAFQFQEPALMASQASGLVSSLTVFKDGQMDEYEGWTTPVNLFSTINPSFSERLSWLTGDDLFVGSATQAEDDEVQGLAGNDTFIGNGSGQYSDKFYGGSGLDMAVYRGRQSEYSIQSISDMWDGRIEGGGRVAGLKVTDNVANRDGIDYLNEVELLRFDDGTTVAGYNTSAIYRFFNTATGAHFYSGNKAEVENVLTNLPNFRFEGASFEKNTVQDASTVDVFRFYNLATNTHFFTANQAEANSIRASLPNYRYEGVAYQAHNQDTGAATTELYRFFNTQTGTHFYTASAEEMANVRLTLSGTMNYEGVAYYVDA